MSTFDTLPIVLLSAANEAAATALISELIDNDVTDDYRKDTQTADRVWRLVNKYYTANVRVHPLTDDVRLDVDPDAVEAHLVHITEAEVSDGDGGVSAAAARAARAGSVWCTCAVRLVLADADHEPATLCAWAAAARAEPVALREVEGSEGDEAGEGGAARARAALHAHHWRGLLRTDRAARGPLSEEEVSDSSSGAEDSEAEELRAVEHAEVFAAALGSLGPEAGSRARSGSGSGAGPGPGPGVALPDAVRRERAEALVSAFCRALGYDLDAC